MMIIIVILIVLVIVIVIAPGPPTQPAPQQSFVRSKQRDPNPKGNSLVRKDTSTYKGFHSTFAALFSY